MAGGGGSETQPLVGMAPQLRVLEPLAKKGVFLLEGLDAGGQFFVLDLVIRLEVGELQAAFLLPFLAEARHLLFGLVEEELLLEELVLEIFDPLVELGLAGGELLLAGVQGALEVLHPPHPAPPVAGGAGALGHAGGEHSLIPAPDLEEDLVPG